MPRVLRLFNPSVCQQPPTPPDEMTVADVVAEYLRAQSIQQKLGNRSDKGASTSRDTLDAFAADHGHRLIRELCNDDLIEWILEHPEWESPHTRAHRMGLVVTAFRWATDRNKIVRCPFRRDSKLWHSLQPRAAIAPDEYKRLLDAARYRKRPRFGGGRVYRKASRAFRLALYFLWETGCRTCEMRELIWSQVDLDLGAAVMDEHKTARATGQPRVIVLTRRLVRLLRWLRRRTCPAPSARVFLNSRGKPWDAPGFARLFRRYGKLAGIRAEVSPYSLRHGFCVRALANRIGQRQIADVMGHTTTRYVEWYARSARGNVEYLRGILDDMNATRQGKNRRPEN